MQSARRERGVGSGDHQKDRGMIKLPQKSSSGCVGGEVVGCRAAEHRDKRNGIDEARREDRQVANTCDAHQHSGADYAREGARHVYETVCGELELVGAILGEPSCCTHRLQT